jgi:hypothetical protein
MRAHWDAVFWAHAADVELVNMGIGMVQPVRQVLEAVTAPMVLDRADEVERKWLALEGTEAASREAEIVGPEYDPASDSEPDAARDAPGNPAPQ